MEILIQIDTESDSLYVGFASRSLEQGAAERTVRVTEDIAVDLDAEGRLIGLDIMNASSVLPGDYAVIRLDELVGVKEASELVGVQKSNFVRDYAARADFPKPVSELGTGRIWLRSQVSDYLAKRQNSQKRAG